MILLISAPSYMMDGGAETARHISLPPAIAMIKSHDSLFPSRLQDQSAFVSLIVGAILNKPGRDFSLRATGRSPLKKYRDRTVLNDEVGRAAQ